ncbi:MAG: hypothetical protein IH600_03020 [Bacteroidetes bacterium]|nr:hypothetical protein [Bacteroidota bacterium]
MNTSTETSSHERRNSRRPALLLFAAVAMISAGLYVWSSFLQTVRYEIEIDPPRLYTGSIDTARIDAWAVNRWDGHIPFSRPTISAELIEGRDLGYIMVDESGSMILFISNGSREGQVALRVFVKDWPFPMLAVIHVAAPIAAVYPYQKRNDV